MPIINSKVGAPGPNFTVTLFGLNDIKNDGNPVFIVVTHHASMGVSGIGSHNPVFLACKLSSVIVLFKFGDLVPFHLNILLPLLLGHSHPPMVNNFVALINWGFLIKQLNGLLVFLGGQFRLINYF